MKVFNKETHWLCQYSDWAEGGAPGFNSQQGQGFPLCHQIQTSSGTNPTYQIDTGAFSTGHEANYSPPFRAGVKNAWSYTSTPPMYSWHGT